MAGQKKATCRDLWTIVVFFLFKCLLSVKVRQNVQSGLNTFR